MSFLVCEVQHTFRAKNCCVKIVLSKSSFSRTFFEFITASDHVCIKLKKLNEIDFELHRLAIEETLVKPKKTESSL